MALSIAVVGAGGIGSAFAHYLARAGNDVTVVARRGSSRLRQLERDQGIVRTNGERAPVGVSDHLDEDKPFDLVIVTTLAHQVGPLLEPLRRSNAAAIHFMFNVFDPERLSAAVGESRCTFGMPFIMSKLDSEGAVDCSVSQSRKSLHGDQRWVDLFTQAGVPSVFEPQIMLWLRCHTPVCVAMESICVAGQRRGKGAAWREAMAVARGVKSGFAIIKGMGYRLHPSKTALAGAPAVAIAAMLWGASRISSFRKLLATGLNECRALADVLAAAATHTNPLLPDAAKSVLAMKPD